MITIWKTDIDNMHGKSWIRDIGIEFKEFACSCSEMTDDDYYFDDYDFNDDMYGRFALAYTSSDSIYTNICGVFEI